VRALSSLPLPGTPHELNARPHQSPVSRIGASCRRRHSAGASSDWRQIVSRQSTPQAAAISGAIDQSTSRGRHQHPDRGSPERSFEPASPLRPDHRQGSIPIGRDPRSAASFNQASAQSRAPAAPVDCALTRDRAEPSIIPRTIRFRKQLVDRFQHLVPMRMASDDVTQAGDKPSRRSPAKES
jgi:hypothetical protein